MYGRQDALSQPGEPEGSKVTVDLTEAVERVGFTGSVAGFPVQGEGRVEVAGGLRPPPTYATEMISHLTPSPYDVYTN